jgi:hypothetical protein
MNHHDRTFFPAAEARIQYMDGEFRIVRQGSHVRCAVTGEAIAIEDLKYWSVDRQEAYASAQAAVQRFREAGR